MTQPLNRNAKTPELGEVDREGGEVWVDNPFLMPSSGINLSAWERNRLYLNRDGRSFVEASFASQADVESDSRGIVAADFDRDGAPDLLVLSVGGGPLRLFRNLMKDDARWVRLDLVGTSSNRAAIGSRVILEAGGRRIVRDLFPQNGGFGQGPPELLIGVGAAETIERLTVRWPSGETQEFLDLPVGARLTITEGSEEVGRSELVQVSEGASGAVASD